MAGQDAVYLLVESNMDLIHKNLTENYFKKYISCFTRLVVVEAWIWFAVGSAVGNDFAVEVVNVDLLHLLEGR